MYDVELHVPHDGQLRRDALVLHLGTVRQWRANRLHL